MATSELELTDPLLLVDRQEELAGSLALSVLSRLSDILNTADGSINYLLSFGRDKQGVPFIRGEFSTKLKVRCQRCMQPMELPLENTISLGIVRDLNEVQNLPGKYEPVLVEDNRISLVSLFEEEILLALPIAPVHSRGECPAEKIMEKLVPEKHNPFSVLKDLKFDK